jgi:hypothetical protein
LSSKYPAIALLNRDPRSLCARLRSSRAALDPMRSHPADLLIADRSAPPVQPVGAAGRARSYAPRVPARTEQGPGGISEKNRSPIIPARGQSRFANVHYFRVVRVNARRAGHNLRTSTLSTSWPAGTRRAIVSMGRKNAKTTLSACLLLAHLCGPPARNRPNSELYSAAQSRDQAGIIFTIASKMVRLNSLLDQTVRIQETAKTLICSELGTRYRALSAEATTAFGLSPSLIIHDELGRVRGPRSGLYEALETAVGAQESPLSIIISTQAATDGDLMSILIDDALSGLDPTTVVKLYAAPPISILSRRKPFGPPILPSTAS